MMTIYGFSGSTTEEYARVHPYISDGKHYRKFIPLDLGDINGDDVISIADAVALQKLSSWQRKFH